MKAMAAYPARRQLDIVDVDETQLQADAELKLVLRNQLVFGTVNAGLEDYQEAVAILGRLMRNWPAQVRALITGQFSLEQAPALLTGQAGRGRIKSVVLLGPPVGEQTRQLLAAEA